MSSRTQHGSAQRDTDVNDTRHLTPRLRPLPSARAMASANTNTNTPAQSSSTAYSTAPSTSTSISNSTTTAQQPQHILLFHIGPSLVHRPPPASIWSISSIADALDWSLAIAAQHCPRL
ncbi:hypothetical protein K439DRAFT_1626818 [Ramaria rubella]|nr:hypothetical protein K439DRAFT_1626818 [Ramaria rubella]